MSLQAITWAFEQELPSGKKLLLVALADAANHDHVCWPSLRRLQKMTCLGRSTILRYLDELERDGVIARQQRFRDGGQQTSTSYTITALEQLELVTDEGPRAGPPRPAAGPLPSRAGTPAVPQRDPMNRKGTRTEPISASDRARAFETWLGEDGRAALELFTTACGASDTTLVGLHGLYGPNGTDARAWGSLPAEKRPQAMATALQRYAAEGHDYNGRFFRRFVETAARDATGESTDERTGEGRRRRAGATLQGTNRTRGGSSPFDELSVDTGGPSAGAAGAGKG